MHVATSARRLVLLESRRHRTSASMKARAECIGYLMVNNKVEAKGFVKQQTMIGFWNYAVQIA